ncbi:MAG: GntR family transcriptional regulator [Clostridiales Family XIII bacterium]|jgi:DNA-binding GntR family transcriptional regulator|nr:GntR family transcriptional regulator [Clostridiales Family XIII bacterium]
MKNQILSTELVNKLREEIINETLRPGSKLTERYVSDQYDVSRTPVREAFQSLAAEGLIEMKPNKGAFVTGFNISEIIDMVKLRIIYEIQAAKWAAQRITEDELDSLDETIDFFKFYTKNKDVQKVKDINEVFHQNIYSAAHMRMLNYILDIFSKVVYLSPKSESYSIESLDIILEEHILIVEAIRNKDTEKAADAMKNHLTAAYERAFNEELLLD